MIVGVSRRSLARGGRLCLRAAALAAVLLYLMPAALGFVWRIWRPAPEIRDDRIWKKPLQVFADNLKNSLVYEKNLKNLIIFDRKRKENQGLMLNNSTHC